MYSIDNTIYVRIRIQQKGNDSYNPVWKTVLRIQNPDPKSVLFEWIQFQNPVSSPDPTLTKRGERKKR